MWKDIKTRINQVIFPLRNGEQDKHVLIACIKCTLQYSERERFESNVLYKDTPFLAEYVSEKLGRIAIYSKTSIDGTVYKPKLNLFLAY